MRLLYKIITLFLVFAIAISFCIPSYAVSEQPILVENFALGDFWGALANLIDLGNITAEDYLNATFSQNDAGCPSSPDGFHHWQGDVNIGLLTGLFSAECIWCHMNYKYYQGEEEGPLTEEDVKDLYDDYVSSLPLPSYSSGGYWEYWPVWNRGNYSSPTSNYGYAHLGSSVLVCDYYTTFNTVNFVEYADCDLSLLPGTYQLVVDYYSGAPYSIGSSNRFFKISPDSRGNGSYAFIYLSASGNQNSVTTFSVNSESSALCFYYNVSHQGFSGKDPFSTSFLGHLRCVSLSSSVSVDVDVSESSRPTGINFDFGTYNEITNEYTYYTDITIVNEGSSTYYNPVTNVTHDLSGWSYDYSTRTYNVTTEEGDSYNITYGDNELTINEGSTTYNLYYMMEQQPEPACTHEYVQSDYIAPSCTANGYKVFTCSNCGSTYREVVFALGHDWQFVETVEAVYDENEELVSEAYDLYRCTRCNEERHETPGNALVDDSSNNSGFFSWLQQWLNDFKEWLGEQFDALTGNDTDINVSVPIIDTDINPSADVDVNYTDSDGNAGATSVGAIVARFAWFKDVLAIGTMFAAMVGAFEAAAYEYDGSGSATAPSIKMDLGSAVSNYGYDYGGEVEMLDLSWYTPYKQTVDNIVSGFLWLAFLWALFRHAPGIIGGAGLTHNKMDDLREGSKHKR